ncbi:MAG TPA: DUF3142 domain-containing protein [Chthoniobacterales bacterium]
MRAGLLLKLFALLPLLSACSRPAPLQNGVYVWQQKPDRAVGNAIERAAPRMDIFYLHAADWVFRNNQATTSRFEPDWQAIRASKKPAGLVLRISFAQGGLGSSPRHAPDVIRLGRSLIDSTRSAGIACGEFQIDYDCPESKLAIYAAFLKEIQSSLPDVSLTFTALPSWLKHPEFKQLARVTNRHVLQVHSLELPNKDDSTATLCDPSKALTAIDAASRIGVPFWVALPTYRCLVVLNEAGERIEIISENLSSMPAEGARVIPGAAVPGELAALMARLRLHPPKGLLGVVWFRLPVDTDRMNWSWPTLQAVMDGRVPESRLRVTANSNGMGTATVEIQNFGEQGEDLPALVQVRWQSGTLVAADGLKDYTMTVEPGKRLCSFRHNKTKVPFPELPPGEKRTIGWIRTSQPEPLEVEMIR